MAGRGARRAHELGGVLAANLYDPLGMTSTSSRFADYARSPNRAFGHVRVGGRWQAKFTRDPDAQAPAGGASASVADLAQWLRLLLADGVYNGKRLTRQAGGYRYCDPSAGVYDIAADALASFFDTAPSAMNVLQPAGGSD